MRIKVTPAGGIRRSAMRQIRITFFLTAAALTFSACGLLGGSDGADVAIAEDVTPAATVNSVQAAPVTPQTEAMAEEEQGGAGDAAAALPTAIALPTSAPTPEPTVDRSQPTTYIVQSGDVLGLIAERFDADIAELRRVNGLDGNLIRVGQELTIPAAEPATTTTESAEAAPAESSSDSSTTTTTTTTTSSAPVSCNSAATGHCVQPGESLLGIALKYDVTVESLRSANPGISGDLIRSGDVLNLPGGGAATTTTTTDTTTTTTDTTTTTGTTITTDPAPVATVGPINDADCAARNPEFPFFHAADGLCYANPIGGTTTTNALGQTTQVTPQPTAFGGDIDQDCREGFFLWSDGLCYPIPGVTVVPTPGPTTAPVQADYGRPPCRSGYVVLVATNRCWPEDTTTNPTTVTPTPVPGTTSTTTSTGTATSCSGVNFTEDAAGKCFLTQEGADANCEVINNVATCP